jgi:hypothetical protein
MTFSSEQSIRNVCGQYALFSPIFSLFRLTVVSLGLPLDSNSGTPSPILILLFSVLPCPDTLPPHSLTVAMMSRITLRPRSFASRSDSVIYSEMRLQGFPRLCRDVLSGMAFVRSAPKAQSQSDTAFFQGRSDGLSTVPEEGPSGLTETISATATTTIAATGSSSRTRNLSECDANVVDSPTPLRRMGLDELHELGVAGNKESEGGGPSV